MIQVSSYSGNYKGMTLWLFVMLMGLFLILFVSSVAGWFMRPPIVSSLYLSISINDAVVIVGSPPLNITVYSGDRVTITAHTLNESGTPMPRPSLQWILQPGSDIPWFSTHLSESNMGEVLEYTVLLDPNMDEPVQDIITIQVAEDEMQPLLNGVVTVQVEPIDRSREAIR